MIKADAQQTSGNIDSLQGTAQRCDHPFPERQRIAMDIGVLQDVESPTAELHEHTQSLRPNESERTTFLKRSIVDRIQKLSTLDTLEHLLRRLDGARRRRLPNHSTYTGTMTPTVTRLLLGAHRHNGSARTAMDDARIRTVELHAYPPTVEMDEGQAPGFVSQREIDQSPQQVSTPQAPPSDPFQPGRTIRGRFVLEELIGQGGFANVYRARDLRRDASDGGSPYVALKTLRPELRDRPGTTARLKREFRQTQSLPHPNIVRIFDLDAHDGVWFMIMELLEGETLATRLHRLTGAPMPFASAHALLAGCADVLSFVHDHHLVHGDFKPTNVFILHDGSVRIVDFGSSTEISADVSAGKPDTVNKAATPAYASPQVLACAAAEPRDDLFSFACVTFEMLAGYHPFALQSSVETQVWGGTVPDCATISPELMAVLKQGLAWRREDRPASVREFFQSLTTLPAADPEPIHCVENLSTDIAPAPSPLLPVPDDHIAHNVSANPEIDPSAAASGTMTQPAAATAPPVPAVAYSATIPIVSTPPHADHEAQPPPVKATLTPPSRTSPLRLLYACSILLVVACLGFLMVRAPQAEPPPAAITRATSPIPYVPLKLSLAVLALQQGGTNSFTDVAATTQRQLQVKPSAAVSANKRAQAVSFSTDSMTVTSHAVLAAIVLKRTNGQSGRLRVAWQVNPGSAKYGQDFSGPTAGSAEFADNQQVRTLFVPLLNNPNRNGDRTFVVKLTDASTGAVIGPVRTVRVTIVDVS